MPVDFKGPDAPTVQRLARWIRSCGLVHFAYRSDREPAIRALLNDAAKLAGDKSERDTEDTELEPPPAAVPKESHVGESQSNGASERSIQLIEDMIRTLKLNLEDRLQLKIPMHHLVITWMVEHAATLLITYHEHSDWEHMLLATAWHTCTKKEIVEFGETVFYYIPKNARRKLDPRWKLGVCLGKAWGPDQSYIGVPDGSVIRARALVRVVASKRWPAARLARITMTPKTKKGNNDVQHRRIARPSCTPTCPWRRPI